MWKDPFMASWEYYDKMFVVCNCLDHTIETQATTTTGIEYIDTFAHSQ